MKAGDLVRGVDGTLGGTKVQLATVLSVELAWPGDEYDETMTVTILESIGKVTQWYDWQLLVIDEWELNDDSR